jgi:hypothetical protein
MFSALVSAPLLTQDASDEEMRHAAETASKARPAGRKS